MIFTEKWGTESDIILILILKISICLLSLNIWSKKYGAHIL